MKSSPAPTFPCGVCRQHLPLRHLIPGHALRPGIVDQVQHEHPTWQLDDYICRQDLDTYRTRYVHSLLEEEKGELTSLEREVVESLRDHELLAKDVDSAAERSWSLGERLADRIADFGGSWPFLICFFTFLGLWILVNSLSQRHAIDPYPYILLNLLLSCLAAVQAPVIMMSQNRQEAKDRLRALHDYQINLKAELEIRHLHEKMDHLLSRQWERLVAIQEVQLELLAELGRKR